jgi:hypothetical protein
MSAITETSAPMRRWTFGGLFGTGLLVVYVGIMLIWLLFPIVLVLLASFQGRLEVSLSPSDFNLEAYKTIPPAYWEAFWFTVRTALTATALALLVAIPAAWAKRLEPRQFGVDAKATPVRPLEGDRMAHARSTQRATPMPPPMQSVASPLPALRRAISWSSVTSTRAPDAPTGWPMAMAPPLTLTMSGSQPIA